MADIREGRDSDGQGIAALIAAVFEEYEGCPFVPAEFPELAAPASHFAGRGGALWVCETAGAIVGSFALSRVSAETFEIHKVYLATGRRGTGLARAMFDAAAGFAAAAGGRRFRLWTDTRFVAGHRFYEKQGFTRLPVVRYLADAGNTWEFAYTAPVPGRA